MNPRLRRMQADYELVREVFSGHPHVSIEPTDVRRPPESYRIAFRLRGLFLKGEQPDYRDVHHVEVTLPRHYPAEKPYVVPVEPIFHPNIRDYFCIADYWAAGTTLADVIVKLGDMIQWRVYNTASPLDAIAARWASEQESNGLFPIGNVDLGVADFEVAIRSRDSMGPGVKALAPLVSGGDSQNDSTAESGNHAIAESGNHGISAAGSKTEEDLVVLLRTRDNG